MCNCGGFNLNLIILKELSHLLNYSYFEYFWNLKKRINWKDLFYGYLACGKLSCIQGLHKPYEIRRIDSSLSLGWKSDFFIEVRNYNLLMFECDRVDIKRVND